MVENCIKAGLPKWSRRSSMIPRQLTSICAVPQEWSTTARSC